MSASNWAVCPRCTARNKAKARDLLDIAAAAYGNVSASEYDALLAEANAANVLHDAVPATFREDYEIHGASTGIVTVSYGGSCGKCGLSLSFTDNHPIPGVTS